MEMRTCGLNKMGDTHITIVMSGPVLITLFMTDGQNTEDLLVTPTIARFNPT